MDIPLYNEYKQLVRRIGLSELVTNMLSKQKTIIQCLIGQ